MNKPVLAVSAVVVAAGLIAPKFIGNQVESSLNQVVESINEQPGYTVEVTDFQQGWFASSAKVTVLFDETELNLTTPDTDDFTAFSLTFDVDTQHGPFTFSNNGTLGLFAWQASIVDSPIPEDLDLGGQPIYSISSNASLFGNHSFTDTIPAFTYQIPASDELNSMPTEMTFKGYQGVGSVKGTEIIHDAAFGKMTFTQENGETVVAGMAIKTLINGTFEQIFETGVYDSDMIFSIDSVVAKGGVTNSNINMKDLAFYAKSVLNEEQNIMDMVIGYKIKHFTNDEFVADDMIVELEMNKFNGELMPLFKDMQNNTVGDDGLPNAEAMQQVVPELITAYLNTNPELNFSKIAVKLKEGQFNGELNTQFVDALPLPEKFNNPQFWLSHLLADASIVADKAVLVYITQELVAMQIAQNPQAKDMTPEQITAIAAAQSGMVVQNLLQQGFLIENEERYETKLLFKDKQLTVNEQVIPLPL